MIILNNDIFKDFSIVNKVADVDYFASHSNNNYASRNQPNSKLVKEDGVTGKRGEWVAYYALKPFFPDITEPDMNIYRPGSKNWNTDMQAGKIEFACKTCDQHTIDGFTLSWIVQRQDKTGYGRDLRFYGKDNQNDLFIGIELNKDATSGHIAAIIPVKFIVDNKILALPGSTKMQEVKDAIYASHLTFFGIRRGFIHSSVFEFLKKYE